MHYGGVDLNPPKDFDSKGKFVEWTRPEVQQEIKETFDGKIPFRPIAKIIYYTYSSRGPSGLTIEIIHETFLSKEHED